MTARSSRPSKAGKASADAAKWSFTAVGPVALDPGKSYKLAPKHAPTKTIDIANGSTTNGTAVQEYDSWGGPGQKLVLKDAGKGNVKLTMKANTNKCLGPKGHAENGRHEARGSGLQRRR